MKFSVKHFVAVAVLLLTTSGVYGAKQHLHLDNDFMLDYEVMSVNGSQHSITFDIMATNISGWIGLGVNAENSDMRGADLFIGGVRVTNETWGDDYYVPKNASASNGTMKPIRDTIQNWNATSGWRNGANANITITRLLDTKDAANDTIISDKSIFLIWAYNRNDSDANVKHSKQGSKSINLLAQSDSGSDKTMVGICTLILGVIAALKS